MKSTPWRKPVADCGGISSLIRDAYCRVNQPDCMSPIDVILHAYREVGTSLEAAIEVHHYIIVKVRGQWRRKIHFIKFETWRC